MKYNIDYIEFWATGHCNLNCKGCSSCSPISKPWFLDIEQIKNDLSRLKFLDIEIKHITILGGEPLLHPNLNRIMDVVNLVYPQTKIGLITNGFLLTHMEKNFWNKCKDYHVKINVTFFPVMGNELRKEIEKIINNYGIEYHITDKKKFNKILTQIQNSNITKVIEACGCNHAYSLKDGKIARCTVPMVVPLLNNYFNAGMIESGTLDIYNARSGSEVIEFLEMPNEACRNCSDKPIKVDWEKIEEVPQLSDWII